MELSIIELFLNASLVVKAVILILIAASVFSWMIIFERWVYLNKSKEEILVFEDNFWSSLESSPIKTSNLTSSDFLYFIKL